MAVLQGAGWPSLAAGIVLDSFCTLDQQLFWAYSSHGGLENKRPSQTTTAHLRPLHTSHLLTFHWPKQVTWSGPKSRVVEVPSAHHETITGMRMHNSIKGGSKDLVAMLQWAMRGLWKKHWAWGPTDSGLNPSSTLAKPLYPSELQQPLIPFSQDLCVTQ